MNIKLSISCFCLMLILSFFSYAQTAGETGKPLTDSKPKIYQNYLYKFSFETPADWTEISSDDSKTYAKLGTDLLKPNRKGRKEVEESLQKTQILLNMSKYALGMPDNASLVCAVETNSTPRATIEQSATVTELSFRTNFGYTITSSAKKITLGNGVFYSIKMNKTIAPNVKVFQSIYLKKVGNKVLQFVSSYTKSEDDELIEKSLKTLKFSE